MSLVFSDTANKKGIIQLIENTLGFDDGTISGDATKLAQFTADINLALDHVLSIIFQVGGTWQFDDTNHTDWPIITTNLVSGQRDYAFTVDGSSNVILEIYKVMIADENGLFREIYPVDQQTNSPSNYWDGLNTTGQPNTYDKTGNGIFLDPPSNYDEPNGLKVYINREASYFTSADTSKKPGFAGLFHEYLVLRPAYQYAVRKTLSNVNELKLQMLQMEDGVRDYYKGREKDKSKVLLPKLNNSR